MASSSEEEEEAPTQMPAAVPVKKPRMEKVHVVTPPPVDPDSDKEARLRRQRELQEQFRLGLGIWWKFGPSINRLILGGQLVN